MANDKFRIYIEYNIILINWLLDILYLRNIKEKINKTINLFNHN